MLTLTLATVLAGTTACIPLPSPLGPEGAERIPTAAPSVDVTTGPGEDATTAPDEFADVFAEREEFFREQQLPMDGSLLTAVTPAQQQFIAEQRAYVEQQGGSWSATEESVSLALAADACETSILNRHQIDASTLTTHVTTSPLFAQLLPADLEGDARTQAEAHVASVMAFGTTFLCPDDGDQWVTAYREVYGG